MRNDFENEIERLKKLNINFLLISEQALYQRGKYKVVLKCNYSYA